MKCIVAAILIFVIFSSSFLLNVKADITLTLEFYDALGLWLRFSEFATLIGFLCGAALLGIHRDVKKKEEKLKAALYKELL